MDHHISAAIATLLHLHEAVSLPGLGSFTGVYKHATVDQVQGVAHPPSKAITFNGYLVSDDGLLHEYLCTHHDLSAAEAARAIDNYVAEVKAILGRKEIAPFPNVGRLYRDYEGALKFIPDGSNLNADAYGLPAVAAQPVMRQEGYAAAPKTEALPKGAGAQVAYWLRQHPIVVPALAVLLLVVGTYLMFFRQAGPMREDVVATPDARINISPSQVELDTPRYDEDDDLLTPGADEEAEATPLDTEGPTLRPNQKSATIAIGVFGDAKNVERLVKRIYEAGYAPFTEKNGRMTTVGIEMAYEQPREVDAALADIRRKFDTKARVIRR